MARELTEVIAGMPIIYGGNKVTSLDAGIAEAFRPGDRLLTLHDSGETLHIPAESWRRADDAAGAAKRAFDTLGSVAAEQIVDFFESFARRLEDDSSFGPIRTANEADVETARGKGRSTTRLVLTDRMRTAMSEGLRMWAEQGVTRGTVTETYEKDGWTIEQVLSGLGVVGFVFEGRPNVFADAAGVLTTGNTVVLRIGSDALGTARAIAEHALGPALESSGLPHGAISLVDSPDRASAWALFSNPKLSLAIARGSGAAVSQLGAVARQSGIPVSLHGTGGAWLVVSESAEPDVLAAAVRNSLDRKVCNTLNTICIVTDRAADLVPVVLTALDAAGADLGTTSKLHVTEESATLVPEDWWSPAPIERAEGKKVEPRTEIVANDALGTEWEWEKSPEVTLTVVASVDEAINLFNSYSPRFIASLISSDEAEHQRFFDRIDAPFVGNGFTRWVDGQYAFDRPELGLSNWQFGRLFSRGAILSGESVFTVRSRVTQTNPDLAR